VKSFVAENVKDRRPTFVPEKYHQTYRDEFSRALQILLERTDKLSSPQSN